LASKNTHNMALNGSKHGWDVRVVGVIFTVFLLFVSPSLSVSVHENPNEKTMDPTMVETREGSGFLSKVANFLWSSSGSGYQHTWPVIYSHSFTKTLLSVSLFCKYLLYDDEWFNLQDIEFGWRIVTGTIIGFLGSAFGTVGGVGGGGIFVTMLSLIIGFDPKSATAISKCKYYRSLSISDKRIFGSIFCVCL